MFEVVVELQAFLPSTEYFLTETEAISAAGTLNLQFVGHEDLVTDSPEALQPSGPHVFVDEDSQAGHTSVGGAISKSLQLEDLLGSGGIHSPKTCYCKPTYQLGELSQSLHLKAISIALALVLLGV
ncbi:hypothetical protein DSO57_1016983 [Entomophthora muscae]|uniref:Uncharacterized protein n=1 Tax=Entomophthora muscae TaxID=34485 RepID=A0ACC2RJJ7_9FUNG|nr:hypothetical protein DSO57_1016983 [Entomophthora muscae]